MPNGTSSKQRILVIDRSSRIRRDIKGFLENSGRYEVVGEAASLAGAVQHVQSAPPDIVLVDVQMAERDGLGVLSELRLCLPQTTQVVATHADWEEYEKASRAAGAVASVAKTQLFDSLMQTLGELANASRSGPLKDGNDSPSILHNSSPSLQTWWKPRSWGEWFTGVAAFGAAMLQGAPMDSSPRTSYWRYIELAVLVMSLMALIGARRAGFQVDKVSAASMLIILLVLVIAQMRQIRRLSSATRAFEKVEERFQNMPREARIIKKGGSKE